jgi:hypothetical protein
MASMRWRRRRYARGFSLIPLPTARLSDFATCMAPTRSPKGCMSKTWLHYGGESVRAEKFFQRAAALSTETRTLIAAFLSDAPVVPVSLDLGDEI